MTVELSELSLHLGDFIEKVKAGERVGVQQSGENIVELRPLGTSTSESDAADNAFPILDKEKSSVVDFFNPQPACVIAPPPRRRQRGSHKGQFELTPAYYEPWPEGFFDRSLSEE